MLIYVSAGPQITKSDKSSESFVHLLRLDKGEHVGKYGGVHGEPRRVRRVRYHTEHVLQDVSVVPANIST